MNILSIIDRAPGTITVAAVALLAAFLLILAGADRRRFLWVCLVVLPIIPLVIIRQMALGIMLAVDTIEESLPGHAARAKAADALDEYLA